MTEHQWKELSKYFVDNGNRKLSTEEKEKIKLAIDQANSLNELFQVAFASLTIDREYKGKDVPFLKVKEF